jgi:predicted lipid-binding transport protein (Tim44 family)
MGIFGALRPLLRAGGGHSFGGGGGGSSHSSGFGSGGGGGSHVFFFGGGGGSGGSGGSALGGLVVIVIIVVLVLLAVSYSRRRRRSRSGPADWGGSTGAPPTGNGSAYGGATAAGGEPAPWARQSGAQPGSPDGGWDHGDRPAAESVRGTLFPGTAAAGGVPQVGEDPNEGLAAIAARDPGFDREAFLEACQRCFFVVQEAWSERKPEMSRQVMADGLWQQHRVQIQGYIDEHKRNILGDLAVGSMDIVSAHTDASYDTIVVRVTAACSDYDVSDQNGKVVRGNKRVEQWAEDWTFQRSAQATTKQGGGTLSQKCPNCGAPLNVDLAGVCPYCKAPVMSGDYDWVLARISQLTV